MMDLKRCPHCGSAPIPWVYRIDDRELYFIMCSKCMMSTVKREDMEIVTEDWNERRNLGLRIEVETNVSKI